MDREVVTFTCASSSCGIAADGSSGIVQIPGRSCVKMGGEGEYVWSSSSNSQFFINSSTFSTLFEEFLECFFLLLDFVNLYVLCLGQFLNFLLKYQHCNEYINE